MSHINFRMNLCMIFTFKKTFSLGNITRKRFKSSYYVTTPIYYVNSDPHLGHLFTTCIADAAARYQLLKNPETELKFMTGTDEHGSKVSLSANAKNTEVKLFCDKISQKYKELFDIYKISYTDFVRTTEDRHKETVKFLWESIYKRGYIYKGMHEGWYSNDDETFYTETELLPKREENVRYTITLNRPTYFTKELNYKFKLSHFKDDLLKWLGKGVVKPQVFETILKNFINKGDVMKDISISRPTSRVNWGINVPNDPSQTIYVWLDALCSYLTSSGYPNSKKHWPPDLQVIGKDILRFHGIYWPAFLMAADIEPPKQILCHSHWVIGNQKMSKSLGNVIDPKEEALKYSSEGFRYFLLKQSVFHKDANYNEEEVKRPIFSDLADKLGNLLLRITGRLNPERVFPNYSQEAHSRYCKETAKPLISNLEELPDSVSNCYESLQFNKAIAEIMAALMTANKFMNVAKPWHLKSSQDADHRKIILHFVFETLRVCGILLQPITPQLAHNVLDSISISKNERIISSIRPFSWEREEAPGSENPVLEKEKLFPNSVLKRDTDLIATGKIS